MNCELANAKGLGKTASIHNDKFTDSYQRCFQTDGWLIEIRSGDSDTVQPDTSIPEEACACIVRVGG